MAIARFLNLIGAVVIATLTCSSSASTVNASSFEGGNWTRSPQPSSLSPNSDIPKVGLAWPQANEDADLAAFKGPGVGRVYTWSPHCPGTAEGLGIACIPMLWGTQQVSDFKNLVKPGYAQTVLGFNEPDQLGQANLSPLLAAQMWRDNIQPLKSQGYTLVSPACTRAPKGKQWMKDFITFCGSECTIDAIALHFYGTDPQQFIDYMSDMHNTFGRTIWVTEFACEDVNGGGQCSEDEVWNFMVKSKEFMNQTPWVEAYFAFGAMRNTAGSNSPIALMNPDGTPTDLGLYYIS